MRLTLRLSAHPGGKKGSEIIAPFFNLCVLLYHDISDEQIDDLNQLIRYFQLWQCLTAGNGSGFRFE